MVMVPYLGWLCNDGIYGLLSDEEEGDHAGWGEGVAVGRYSQSEMAIFTGISIIVVRMLSG
jgi:hypothetical protein